MATGTKKLSDSCHVVTMNIVTGHSEDYILGRMFASCLRLRNSLAGNARHRIFRLMQNAEYRILQNELRSILRQEKPDAARKKAVTTRLAEIRTAYGLGSYYQFAECIAPIRRKYFKKKHVPSHVAQAIAADVWSGVEKVLFGDGKMLSSKNEHNFLSIRGKTNASAIMFSPVTMRLRVGDLELAVRAKDDAYTAEALAAMRRSYASERESRGALPGCIRYCAIRRHLVNDHGAVRYAYRLLITCDGPAPERMALAPATERESRTAAIDPSMAMMALCDSDGDTAFLLLDGKNPKTKAMMKDAARRMDASRRATNPERYSADGTFDKSSVNARTGEKEMNRSAHYVDLYMRRKLQLQKQSETLKGRRAALCNTLVRTYGTIRTEGMRYVALSVRAKDVRFVKGGRIASKSRFGSTIQRFAPASFLAELRRKAEASGTTFEEINPWTLKASQYDPTDGQNHKHRLSERIYALSDGTAVQRDLMAAFTILHSQKVIARDTKGRTAAADLPDREAMLECLPAFIDSMRRTMNRAATDQRELPPATGAGAWTAPQGTGKGFSPVDVPHCVEGEIPALQRACGGGQQAAKVRQAPRNPSKSREGDGPPGTPPL